MTTIATSSSTSASAPAMSKSTMNDPKSIALSHMASHFSKSTGHTPSIKHDSMAKWLLPSGASGTPFAARILEILLRMALTLAEGDSRSEILLIDVLRAAQTLGCLSIDSNHHDKLWESNKTILEWACDEITENQNCYCQDNQGRIRAALVLENGMSVPIGRENWDEIHKRVLDNIQARLRTDTYDDVLEEMTYDFQGSILCKSKILGAGDSDASTSASTVDEGDMDGIDDEDEMILMSSNNIQGEMFSNSSQDGQSLLVDKWGAERLAKQTLDQMIDGLKQFHVTVTYQLCWDNAGIADRSRLSLDRAQFHDMIGVEFISRSAVDFLQHLIEDLIFGQCVSFDSGLDTKGSVLVGKYGTVWKSPSPVISLIDTCDGNDSDDEAYESMDEDE